MTARKKAKASTKMKAARPATKKTPSSAKKKASSQTLRKKASAKPAAKKAKKSAAVRSRFRTSEIVTKEPLLVQPGPPAGVVPPVEEPAPTEEAVGVVTHYYSDLGVAVVQMNKGALRTNDRIRIKGQTTDRTQVVGSIEYEHQHVDQAEAGQCVGIKVFDHARVHDIVYLVK